MLVGRVGLAQRVANLGKFPKINEHMKNKCMNIKEKKPRNALTHWTSRVRWVSDVISRKEYTSINTIT